MLVVSVIFHFFISACSWLWLRTMSMFMVEDHDLQCKDTVFHFLLW